MKSAIQLNKTFLICLLFLLIACSCSKRDQRKLKLYESDANAKVSNVLGVELASDTILYFRASREAETLIGSTKISKDAIPDCNWIFARANTGDATAVLGSANSHFDAVDLPLIKDQLNFTTAEDYFWAKLEGGKSGVLIYRVGNSTLYFDFTIAKEN